MGDYLDFVADLLEIVGPPILTVGYILLLFYIGLCGMCQ